MGKGKSAPTSEATEPVSQESNAANAADSKTFKKEVDNFPWPKPGQPNMLYLASNNWQTNQLKKTPKVMGPQNRCCDKMKSVM